MLKDWQIKFPLCFARFPHLFTNLGLEEQDALSELLHFLEKERLLDDHTVNYLFENSPYLSECIYVISSLRSYKCLTKSMLNHVITQSCLTELQESIEILSSQTTFSASMLKFLCTTLKPTECAAFIIRTLKNEVDATVILHFLTYHVDVEGLSRATTLFDLSDFSYRQDHFPTFKTLTQVLANPLCQTIFDARLRGFSDYSMSSEPLRSNEANKIITRLVDEVEEEEKIRIFFDFFTAFRPFPPSQKYIVDVDIESKVTAALMDYCKITIAAIASLQDSVQAQKLITTLRREGGDRIIFNKIKYAIASDIEAEDLCSTRTYDGLMEEIWLALNQPQVNLEMFDDPFDKAGKPPNFFSQAPRVQTLPNTASQDAMDVESKDKMTYFSMQ